MGTVILLPLFILLSNYVAISKMSQESKIAYAVFLVIVIVLWLITNLLAKWGENKWEYQKKNYY